MIRRRAEKPGPGRPAFASAAVATYSTQVGAALLGFGNVLLVARVLGPAGRGEVAYLITIAVLPSTLALMGVEQANVNFASREPRLRSSLLANSLALSALFGGVTVAVLAGLMLAFPVLGGGVEPGLRWVAIASIPILVLQQYLQFLLQADYRFAVINVTLLLPSAMSLLVNGVFSVVGNLSVASAIATWIVGQGTSSAILLRRAFRDLDLSRLNAALARRTLGFGLKSHPGRVMNLANYRLDQWILAAVAGTRELGLYSVAVSWAETLFFLPTALAIVQRPDLARAPREEASGLAALVFRMCTILTAPLALGLIVLAPFLCVTVFGPDFRGSVDDLRVLAVGGFGIAAVKLLDDALAAQGRQMLGIWAVAIGLVTTVVLDALLIPRLNGLGAAIASSVAYTASGTMIAMLFAKALGGSLRSLVPRWSDVREILRQGRTVLTRRSRVVHGPTGSS